MADKVTLTDIQPILTPEEQAIKDAAIQRRRDDIRAILAYSLSKALQSFLSFEGVKPPEGYYMRMTIGRLDPDAKTFTCGYEFYEAPRQDIDDDDDDWDDDEDVDHHAWDSTDDG